MTHDARILDFNHRHLGGRMDHRAALILAASLLCGSVHAGYAQLAPPPGWTGGGGAAATFSYPSAANAATLSNGTVVTNASLNVGGKAVRVPASMRIAANAGRIAAAAIYLHPGLRTVAAVAAWIGAAGLVYDVADGLWKKGDGTVSTGLMYTAPAIKDQFFSTVSGTCDGLVRYYSGVFATSPVRRNYAVQSVLPQACLLSHETRPNNTSTDWSSTTERMEVDSVNCPLNWFVTSAGCMQTQPMRVVPKEEFERMVPDARPMPPELPGVVWPASWPVEVPEIQPMFIPTGNPVPNPKYDPSASPSPNNQPWLQPGVKLSPAPTPNAPWQVDLQPVNRPTDSPAPKPDPVQDPVPNPDGSGNNDKPRDPEKDERDFCEKNPDVLACQKVDEPEDPGKLKVQEVDFNFQPESGFAGSASCPSPITVSLSGRVYSISWQPFCNSLNMIKPFLLAMAWLSAAFIMLGARKE